jgi:flagellar basal-body rod modification protein FlgD
MSLVSYVSSSVNTGATTTSSTSSTASSSDSLNDDKTAFLKLLTTQLQHQDPLDPVDTTEFTNQLISYSSLEQLMNMNSQMGDVVSALSSSNSLSAFSYLGADVEVDSSTATLQDSQAEWNYVVGSDASNVTLQVTDSSGKAVYSKALTGVTAGTYNLAVDAADMGTNLTDGSTYKLSVVATDSSGNSVTTDANGIVTVDNVQSASGDITLSAGSMSFSSDDIVSLSKAAA